MLSPSPKLLNEDVDQFWGFFERRYNSLIELRKETPRILREIVKWLDNEVFLQVDDGNGADVDKEQEEYEKALYDQISEAKNNDRRWWEVAARQIQDMADDEE